MLLPLFPVEPSPHTIDSPRMSFPWGCVGEYTAAVLEWNPFVWLPNLRKWYICFNVLQAGSACGNCHEHKFLPRDCPMCRVVISKATFNFVYWTYVPDLSGFSIFSLTVLSHVPYASSIQPTATGFGQRAFCLPMLELGNKEMWGAWNCTYRSLLLATLGEGEGGRTEKQWRHRHSFQPQPLSQLQLNSPPFKSCICAPAVKGGGGGAGKG